MLLIQNSNSLLLDSYLAPRVCKDILKLGEEWNSEGEMRR